MKRTKYLALVLVVAIMMMGAGYAYWTDTLVLQENITMGNLDVEWQRSDVVADANWKAGSKITNVFLGKDVEQDILVSNGFKILPNPLDKSKATVTLENVYPGAVIRWDGTIKNVGSIPVKFNNATIVFEEGDVNNPVLPWLEVTYQIDKSTVPTPGWNGWLGRIVSNWGVAPFPLSTLADKLNDSDGFKNTTLLTGEKLSFGSLDENVECIIISVREDAPNEIQNKSFSFTLDFEFIQANITTP